MQIRLEPQNLAARRSAVNGMLQRLGDLFGKEILQRSSEELIALQSVQNFETATHFDEIDAAVASGENRHRERQLGNQLAKIKLCLTVSPSFTISLRIH
jgi:hypothetical protein